MKDSKKIVRVIENLNNIKFCGETFNIINYSVYDSNDKRIYSIFREEYLLFEKKDDGKIEVRYFDKKDIPTDIDGVLSFLLDINKDERDYSASYSNTLNYKDIHIMTIYNTYSDINFNYYINKDALRNLLDDGTLFSHIRSFISKYSAYDFGTIYDLLDDHMIKHLLILDEIQQTVNKYNINSYIKEKLDDSLKNFLLDVKTYHGINI